MLNKHKVKFIRGSNAAWERLKMIPEKIDNDTLYFIYDDIESSTDGQLFLGKKLISDNKIININDIGNIQINDENLSDQQILIYDEENQKWENSSLEEIIDLSNYYTKDEVNNLLNNSILEAIANISTLSFQIINEKPNENIQTNVIYLILKSTAETDNVYDEWIYVNNAWELIGTTEINLDNYYSKEDLANNFDFTLAIDSHDIEGDEPSMSMSIAENLSNYKIHKNIYDKIIFDKPVLLKNLHGQIYYVENYILSSNSNLKVFFKRLLNIDDINNKENISNKVVSLSINSTNEEYPSAKAVYDAIENISLTPGPQGENGKSAYMIAVEEGFNGTQQEWLASLVGAAGAQGIQGIQGEAGLAGVNGKSAYEVAVDNGFVGTEQQWLTSLIGATGQTGAQGPAGTNGADWIPTEQELNDIAQRALNLLPDSEEVAY